MAKLTTIRNLMAIAPDGLEDGDRDAFSLSLLWAQYVALKADSDPVSDVYARRLTDELSRIAWIVTAASTIGYKQQSDRLAPAAAVRSILLPYLAATEIGPVTRLMDAMAGGAADATLRRYLTTWWDWQRSEATVSAFAVGPLRRTAQGLTAEILFYDVDYTAETWQSFFATRSAQGVTIRARPVSLTLNDVLWADIKADLSARLGDKAAQYISNLDVAL